MYTRLFSAAALLLLGVLLQGCASTSPYQGLTADELFDLGAGSFEDQDWDEAVRVFERFLSSDPTNERTVEARMYLSLAYYNREDYITAVSEFTRVLDRHPGHILAPEASLGICQAWAELSPHIQRDQGYTTQALIACENVIQDFGSFEVSIEAEAIRDRMQEKLAEKVLVAGQFYFQRKMYDSGIIYFNDILTIYPQTRAASQALLRLHHSYLAIGWDREAEDAKERLLRDFPDSKAAAEVRANGDGGDDAASGPGGGR
jgi:outer membrane protein assembly factor BamD